MTKGNGLILVGAAGEWFDRQHAPALVRGKEPGHGPFRSILVVDKEVPDRLTRLGAKIEHLDHRSVSDRTIAARLQTFVSEHARAGMVMSCPPTQAWLYENFALSRDLPVLLDKPHFLAPDSSSDLRAARRIRARHRAFPDVQRAWTPLRRRVAPGYSQVISEIAEVLNKTQQQVRSVSVRLRSGKPRFPSELGNGGGHGAREGVGALAHSGYHYVDLLASILAAGSAKDRRARVQLDDVIRVRDNLAAEAHAPLAELLDVDDPRRRVSKRVGQTETDMAFSFLLFNGAGRRDGRASLSIETSTFSPRTVKLDHGLDDPADHEHGGRRTSFVIDVHAGPLAQWQLSMNESATDKAKSLSLERRVHPSVKGVRPRKAFERFDDAHNPTTTGSDLTAEFLAYVAGGAPPPSRATSLAAQDLSIRLYGAMYEAIAADACGIELGRADVRLT